MGSASDQIPTFEAVEQGRRIRPPDCLRNRGLRGRLFGACRNQMGAAATGALSIPFNEAHGPNRSSTNFLGRESQEQRGQSIKLFVTGQGQLPCSWYPFEFFLD